MLDFNHALTLEARKLCVRRRMMEPVQENRTPRNQTLLVRIKPALVWIPYHKNEGKKLEMIRPNKGTREQRKDMHIFVRTNEGRLRQW